MFFYLQPTFLFLPFRRGKNLDWIGFLYFPRSALVTVCSARECATLSPVVVVDAGRHPLAFRGETLWKTEAVFTVTCVMSTVDIHLYAFCAHASACNVRTYAYACVWGANLFRGGRRGWVEKSSFEKIWGAIGEFLRHRAPINHFFNPPETASQLCSWQTQIHTDRHNFTM